MKAKFLKGSYNLMAALVLTIFVAAPYATQASGELSKGADAELMRPNGGCEVDFCVR